MNHHKPKTAKITLGLNICGCITTC